MSCVDCFLRPKQTGYNLRVPVVTHSPYLNYSSIIYVKTAFIAYCTQTFNLLILA